MGLCHIWASCRGAESGALTIIAGAETDIAGDWRLRGELRYTRVHGVDLEQEGGPAVIRELDDDAWQVGIGLAYDFSPGHGIGPVPPRSRRPQVRDANPQHGLR